MSRSGNYMLSCPGNMQAVWYRDSQSENHLRKTFLCRKQCLEYYLILNNTFKCPSCLLLMVKMYTEKYNTNLLWDICLHLYFSIWNTYYSFTCIKIFNKILKWNHMQMITYLRLLIYKLLIYRFWVVAYCLMNRGGR